MKPRFDPPARHRAAPRLEARYYFSEGLEPAGSWLWTLAFGYREGRTPTHGYAATRKAAMTAFAKS
jgi:hypothetical protein